MNLPGLFKGKYSAFTTTIIYAIAALVCIMVFRWLLSPALPNIPDYPYAEILLIALTAVFIFYILSGKDIRSKTLEDAIVRSEEKWRLTFEEANDPIIILDKNLNIQKVNPKAEELYGYTASEFTKMNILNLRSERTRNTVDLKELPLKKDKGLNYEIEHVKKEGTVFNVAVSTKAIVKNGQIEYVNIIHDITERKKIEEQLLSEEKKYRELIETAPVGIFVSIDGKLEYANPAFIKIMGAKNEQELLGNEVIDYIHPAFHEAVAYRRQQVLEGISSPEMEQVWKRLDGSEVYLSVSAIPYFTEKVKGVQVLVRDITEWKRSEAQMFENQARLNGIVDSAMDAIITIGADRKIIVFNSAAEKMFFCSASDAIGSEISRFIPERFKHVHDSHIERFAATGDTSRGMGKLNPISGVRAGGEEFPIEASISKIEVNGEMLFTVILRDITEKMKAEKAINESRTRLKGIIDSAMDAIITIGADRKIIVFNTAAEKMFLCSSDQAMGSGIDRFIPKRFKNVHNSHIERFAATGDTSRSMGKLNPISGVRANGKEFPIEASISKTEINGEMLFTVILRDITEKVKAEESLNESRIRLKGIVDSAMDAIVTVDNTKKIILFNEAAEKMFLCPSVEAIGSEINRFIPQRFRHIHDSHIDRFASTGETSRSMGKLNAVSGVRANGEEFPIEASISKIEVNGEMLFTVILRDITEKLKTEESVKETNERLHDLAAHLQTIREDERKMLAREIHDQLGQELTALKIDISFLGKKINKLGENGETAEILENLNEMSRLTDHTINTVRRIAKELRPDMLDKLGLKEAVLWMCEDFEKRTGINCKVNIPLDFGFGGNLDTTIFRIIQESLTNAVRHSGGNEVKVSADIKDETIKVIIEDNGKGISEEEIKNTKSLGLLGIRERAYSEGGTLAILNGEVKGARLILTIPFKQS